MLIPREIAELRRVQINRGIDRKKHPQGLSIEAVAPHTLFHHERKGSEERKALEEQKSEGALRHLAASIPMEADGKIPLVILDNKAEQNG